MKTIHTHEAVLALILTLGGCSGKPPLPTGEAKTPPVTVHAQRVRWMPHVATEEITGSVRARLHSVIEGKTAGRIEKLEVVPGQRVKQGEVLVKLDSKEIQAKLDQARAVRDQSAKSLQRYTTMLASRVASQAEFDAVQAGNRVAEAAFAEAQTALGFMTITAPFEGVITRKLADVGDLATPGKPLLEIEDPESLRFEADVPEAISGSIQMGAKLPVHLGAQELSGNVSEVAPVADFQSRTFLIKLDLPATKGLRTGQFGRVSVPVSETRVLRIPAGAVVQRGQMEIVFVVDRDRARMRLVKTGKRQGNEVEILSGIENSEQVITEKTADLIDGQPVEVSAP